MNIMRRIFNSTVTETGEEDVKEYEGMLGVGLTESTVLIFEKEED